MRIKRIPFLTRFWLWYLLFFQVIVFCGVFYLLFVEYSTLVLILFVVLLPTMFISAKLYNDNDIAFMGEMTKEEREALKVSFGDFIYNDEGFTWRVYTIKWEDVVEIGVFYYQGYLDTFSIALTYGENRFIIDEDTEGYKQFLEVIDKAFVFPESIFIILLNIQVRGSRSVSIWRKGEDDRRAK